MKKLQPIYAIYEEHIKAVESFSVVLWADLDVNKIMESTEEVAAKLKKIKHLADMPVYDLVQKEIQGFMAALPLMKELKSDALRKRHWTSLMQVRCQCWFTQISSFSHAGACLQVFVLLRTGHASDLRQAVCKVRLPRG